MDAATGRYALQSEGFWGSDLFAGSYAGLIGLRRAEITYQGAICICRSLLVPPELIARSILSEEERQVFAKLRFDTRRKSLVMGRYAAKNAVCLLSNQKPEEIHIGYGVFNNPLIDSFCGQGRLETSITHTSDIGAGLAFPASHPMGIDIERIDPAKAALIESELTSQEIVLLKGGYAPYEYAAMLTAAWTMKESLSKVFRTGLMTPLRVYEISSLEWDGSCLVAHFRNFGQYKAITFSLGDHICSLACPKKTDCEIDLPRLLAQLC